MDTSDRETQGRSEDGGGPSIPADMERAKRRLFRQLGVDPNIPLDEATLKRLGAASGPRVDEPEDLEDLVELEDIERAQEFAYDAMEADTEAEALSLCEEALALDPRNVDALHVRSAQQSETRADHIEGLTRAVAAGEAALGEAFFEENRGAFYGLIETRPYMRARAALAEALLAEGHFDLALGHYKALLELNPNDNQANRYPLLGLYLLRGEVAAARSLSDLFEEDQGTMEWGLVLLLWLEGDKRAAEGALSAAVRHNAFVAARLQEPGTIFEGQPSEYSPGTDSEVLVVLGHLRPAFESTPGFMPWLLEALAGWDHQRAYEWVERQEKARGESSLDWAVGFFELAAKKRGELEMRAVMAPSETELAWYRLMAADPELRGGGAPGYGFVPSAALTMLSAVPSLETAQLLVDLYVELERANEALGIFADFVDSALADMGPLLVEPALAALDAGHTGQDGFSWLFSQLASAGVRDERIFSFLVDVLPRHPERIAASLEEYGDPAALPVLGVVLDEVLARAKEDPARESRNRRRLCDAIETLGGALTPAQEQALLELSKAPPPKARSAWPGRPAPAEQAFQARAEPQEPLRAKERPGRNEPCWCGSGTKYKRCHLIEDESSAS